MDSSPDEARSDSVVINYRLGIEHALDHLFSLGHRQIGFVGPADKLDDWKQPAPEVRRQLFIHFMSARNDYDSSFLIDVSTNAALTERAVTEHLRQGKPLPTAFLTANEENAIGTVRALKAAGLSIPQDVSIISFNDTPLSELMEPPLTSISTRVQEMSSIAVRADRAVEQHGIFERYSGEIDRSAHAGCPCEHGCTSGWLGLRRYDRDAG